jgi:hypothetical protein
VLPLSAVLPLDIDVLFYGSLNERRRKVLREIESAGGGKLKVCVYYIDSAVSNSLFIEGGACLRCVRCLEGCTGGKSEGIIY